MIAGDSRRRNSSLPWDITKPDPDKSHWAEHSYNTETFRREMAIGVNCLNYQNENEPTLHRHYLPDKAYLDSNCPDGIRFELMFPSCAKADVNGKPVLDSPNHRDHVEYSELVIDGGCNNPEFPIQLPGLMFEVFYRTPDYKSRNGRFVGANGDVDGEYSLPAC